MPGVAEIRKALKKEFDDELAQGTAAKLDASARGEFGNVFNLTVGRFAKGAARRKQPVKVWGNKQDKFKRFIKLQTRKIAKEAKKHAKAGVIDDVVLSKAAKKVMRAAKKCKITIVNGRIVGVPSGTQGDVCSAYLDTKLT